KAGKLEIRSTKSETRNSSFVVILWRTDKFK
ncbi:unnamed protein product, partial [marine sediment metagenome]